MKMSQSNEFAERVVAVVGGNVGVGPAVVKAFKECGAKVLVGSLHASASAELGADTDCISVDLADPLAASQFLDECERRVGVVQILIMVAPPVETRDALGISRQYMQNVIDVELVGPACMLQECARRLVSHKLGGRLISFVSMSGKTGAHKHVAPYAAAKGGLITYSRVLAAELAATGITVNMIATSLFEVQLAGKTDAAMAALVSGIPMGRAGRSEEASCAAMYLASDDSGYVTGETLNLSGGRFMD
ncbi:SDR family NAD(P)-dependent oxidoreductase [Ottowia thiooxydans]|uniref:3-oxoacyl-[acyl-carrier protein] reductase n=1 Tax=Ottowia thiooxydans TaxID=219182 RepID=A0ABV2Q428_9BURK